MSSQIVSLNCSQAAIERQFGSDLGAFVAILQKLLLGGKSVLQSCSGKRAASDRTQTRVIPKMFNYSFNHKTLTH